MNDEAQRTVRLLQALMRHHGLDEPTARVVDLGCGEGRLVEALRAVGLDAGGCDLRARWSSDSPYYQLITWNPYRLPYADASVDAVVSTTVMEHVQNKAEVFREIHRVLRPGGLSIHLYPSKWYLPVEPHVLVPLANCFWPRCPGWWYALWAILGVRTRFQQGMHWQQVVADNLRYQREGLDYRSNAELRRLALAVFGNHSTPTRAYINHGEGGVVRILRRLPGGRGWLGALVCRLRNMPMVQRREPTARPPG